MVAYLFRKQGHRRQNVGVVTANNNKVGKHLLNLRQGRKPSKHFMFVDFQNVFAWAWKVRISYS